MVVHLSDAALFDPEVPAAWRDLVSGLAELDSLSWAELPEGERRSPARLARASEIRERLLAGAGALAEQAPESLRAGSPGHARVFAQAALLWTRFAQSGGRILVDTLGSTTLPYYRADWQGERAAVRAALCRTLGWSDDQVASLDRALEARSSNVLVKNEIAAWVAREVGEGADRPGKVLRLLQRLYGPVPLRPGDLELVLTDTAIMFCLAYQGRGLVSPGYGDRPAEERAGIAAFVERIEKMSNNLESIRLPAFGLFDREALDPTLIGEVTAFVARRPGMEQVTEPVVAATLATMVTLLASPQAEMYLIHDIWGHGWQEILCEFEWPYGRLWELRRPIGAAVLAPAFRGGLDMEALRGAVRADLRERVTLALTVVVAECLADLIEHRYVRMRPPAAAELPSSSLLPRATLKLDLSLRDVHGMLNLAHRPYRRLIAEPAERARLVAELRAAGIPGEGLEGAVERGMALVQGELGHVLDVRQSPPAGGGVLRVNLAQRVMLGVVALDSALTHFLAEKPHCSIELLALLLATAREEEPSVNFWHLDELLRSELGPTFDRFAREVGT
jgi:hypothetical protein